MIKWMFVLLVNGASGFLFLSLDVNNYMLLFAGQSLVWIVLEYTFTFMMWQIYTNKKDRHAVMAKNIEDANPHLLVSNENNIKAGNPTLIYY